MSTHIFYKESLPYKLRFSNRKLLHKKHQKQKWISVQKVLLHLSLLDFSWISQFLMKSANPTVEERLILLLQYRKIYNWNCKLKVNFAIVLKCYLSGFLMKFNKSVYLMNMTLYLTGSTVSLVDGAELCVSHRYLVK